MLNKIREHLTKQYHGVFLSKGIESHINNYVEDTQSTYLIEKISPFVQKGAKILDVGSGYGSFVLSAVKSGYDAYGIEIEIFEHEISKEKALEQTIDSSRFIDGSAIHLPYSNETFDMVSFWNVIEHIKDYKLALQEAKRVLKPGGLLFIIAPNYCAFRKEAHYHVPWFPLLPKSWAGLYLRFLGRKTDFLNNHIFYVTSFGVRRFLESKGLSVSIDISEKILSGYHFKSQKINNLVSFFKKYKLEKILAKIVFFIKTNPFAYSIDIIAKK